MKMTMYRIAGCFLLMAFCATSDALAAQLAGSEWRPTEIGDQKVPADAKIFVRFGGEGKLVGHGGCNRFFGNYKLEGNKIELGPLGATTMACPKPVMDREAEFLQALTNAKRIKRDRIDLSLTNEAGNPVMRLIQTDPD